MSKRIGRPKHSQWIGYVEIKDGNKTVGAKCIKCQKIYTKRDQKTLLTHYMKCNASDDNNEDASINENFEQEDVIDKVQTFHVPDARFQDKDTSNHSTQQTPPALNSTEDKNIALLKLFISQGINFKECESFIVRNFCKIFDPEYPMPTKEELEIKVLKVACNRNIFENATKNHASAAVLDLLEHQSSIFAVSFLLAEKNNPSFIRSLTIDKNIDTDVQSALKEFCEESAIAVMKEYSIKISYFIHSSEYVFSSVSTVTTSIDGNDVTFSFSFTPSFSILLKGLKQVEVTVSAADFSLLHNYDEGLKSLENNIGCKDLTVAEATEELFKFIGSNQLMHNDTYKRTLSRQVLKYLSPVYLTSNFFHPKHHGHYFDMHSTIMDIFEDFVRKTIPNDALDGMASYKEKTGKFVKLYAENLENDYLRFWKLVRIFDKTLSEYALNLVTLPAINKRVNMEVLWSRFQNFPELSSALKSLLFTVTFEETKK